MAIRTYFWFQPSCTTHCYKVSDSYKPDTYKNAAKTAPGTYIATVYFIYTSYVPSGMLAVYVILSANLKWTYSPCNFNSTFLGADVEDS